MTGRELANAIGGNVRELPCDPQWPAFGVEIVPAGCVVLVRDHGNLISISVGARGWRISRDDALPADVIGEAKRQAATHAEDATMVDAALALAPALERAFGMEWLLSIPGGQIAPTEMWLTHERGDDDASVGIFVDAIRVAPTYIALSKRADLDAACAAAIEAVKAQRASYERNAALSIECERVAKDLAARLGKCAATSGRRTPSWFTAVTWSVVDGQRALAHVEARDGNVFVDAGLPGSSGWHGTAADATQNIDAIAHAIDAMSGVVTFDSLDINARYRVIAPLHGLVVGEIVTYGGPIDNHAPHEFTRADGTTVLVEEYALRQSAHEMLSATTR